MVIIERLSNYRALLGESPVYDSRLNRLYWVDIDGHRLIYKDLESGKEGFIDLPDVITSVQLKDETDSLIVTVRHGFYEVNLSNNSVRLIAEVEKEISENRFNDGKCDALGRYWAGTMNIPMNSPTGALYSLDIAHQVKKHLDGLTISNGLAWSLDNKYFYLIDTPPKKVYGFDLDLAKGEIYNKRVVIDFSSEVGRPDGMTIDEEGMLWIAHSRGGRISRWDPKSGKKLLEIELPVSSTTSLTFGGEDLDQIFVTTAVNLAKPGEDLAGYVYVIRGVGVRGVENNLCKV
ncbi:MAG: SMP-30/gluconolactonase/LRE family protein [Sulfolobaceae archaeon]|nr:SMP-30/gluconolactonase/LRE family protein [Sulfolobaceae archaeon]